MTVPRVVLHVIRLPTGTDRDRTIRKNRSGAILDPELCDECIYFISTIFGLFCSVNIARASIKKSLKQYVYFFYNERARDNSKS